MKKVAMFVGGVLGVAVAALLLPANAFANCAPPADADIGLCDGLGEVVFNDDGFALPLSGVFWMQGAGDPANDAGIDSGIYSGLAADNQWLPDLGIPGHRCLAWDWSSAGTDGCPTGAPVWAIVSDNANRSMVVSAAGAGAAPVWTYDFSLTTNGPPAPIFGGATNGLQLGRAVHVSNSSTAAGDVTLNVAALAVPKYDETGASPGSPGNRPYPGTVQLRGVNGAPVVQTGEGAKVIAVDQDSVLCWEIADGALTVPLGCVRVGGNTPSQNVLNAKASIGRGQLNFSWDVSAQFDVLGFNVIQKNATKNTESKVNDSLIPISGMNDAQAASYSFSAGRKDVKATRGGFEIELVRTNGETSRTPAPLR
jgi:hypothetical protein